MRNSHVLATVPWLVAIAILPGHGTAQNLVPIASPNALNKNLVLDASPLQEGKHALRIGIKWLEAQQQEDGCWSNPAFPALTGLAVSAILNGPDPTEDGGLPESAKKGLGFILTCV